MVLTVAERAVPPRRRLMGPQLAWAQPGWDWQLRVREWSCADGQAGYKEGRRGAGRSLHKTTALHWGSGKACSGPRPLDRAGPCFNTTVYCGELGPPSVPTGVPTKVVCKVRAPRLVGWLLWDSESDKGGPP